MTHAKNRATDEHRDRRPLDVGCRLSAKVHATTPRSASARLVIQDIEEPSMNNVIPAHVPITHRVVGQVTT